MTQANKPVPRRPSEGNKAGNFWDNAATIGIGMALLALLLFAFQDAVTKQLAKDYPVVQFVWIRYVVFALLMVLFCHRRGGIKKAIKSKKPALQWLRGSLIVVEIAIFATALRFLGLAEVHAIFAVFPLIVVALSAIILAEPVGPRRWMAVVIGFVGTLIILRPGLGVFDPNALIALAAALIFAFYNLVTRLVSRYDSFETSILYQAGVGAILSSILVPFYWEGFTAHGWLLVAVLCFTSVVGHMLFTQALAFTPAATLQPFNYMALVWASLFAFVFFGEIMDVPTIIGALIVVGSGLFVIWRERQLKKKALREGPPQS